MQNLKFIGGNFLVVLALSLGVSACGDHGITVGSSSNDLSYSIEENGCAYSSPTYSNYSDYCNALENGNLNRDPKTGEECAQNTRQSLFASNCSGTWTPTY
jgi:hypothetical protein